MTMNASMSQIAICIILMLCPHSECVCACKYVCIFMYVCNIHTSQGLPGDCRCLEPALPDRTDTPTHAFDVVSTGCSVELHLGSMMKRTSVASKQQTTTTNF